jgi:predicted Zn-dependent protease
MTRKRAEDVLAVAVQHGGADEVYAVLRSADGSAFPVTDNSVRPPQFTTDASVQLSVRVGKRYTTVQSNDLSPAGLRAALDRAVEQARQMPPSPEAYDFPGPAEPLAPPLVGDAFDVNAGLDAALLAELRERALSAGMRLTGSITATRSTLAVASSAGLFMHQESTLLHGRFRVYADDGWSTALGEHYAFSPQPAALLSAVDTAVAKCRAWKDPVALQPSRLTTVFEPRALAGMLRHLLPQFSARAVENDQSFLRRLDGSSFVGSKLFDERITLRSDPMAAELPSMPFTADGLPVLATTWVRDGVIETVTRDRFSGAPVVAAPTNLLMSGGTTSPEELITGVSRGLLVSDFANLTVIDPKNCLLSGSTRDGLFLVEDGAITRGVRNILIRETPVYLFKELEDMSPAERTSPSESYFPMLLPHLRVKDVLYGAPTGMI